MAKKDKEKKGKDKKEDKPNVHDELKGFDIEINEFGQIKTSYDVNKINKFLNQNVQDKKLVDREDWIKDEEE